MTINVKYFGVIAEVTGKTSEQLIVDAKNADEVNEQMTKIYPGLKELNYAISIDRLLTQGNRELSENCEVALLPPYAGG